MTRLFANGRPVEDGVPAIPGDTRSGGVGQLRLDCVSGLVCLTHPPSFGLWSLTYLVVKPRSFPPIPAVVPAAVPVLDMSPPPVPVQGLRKG